MNNTAILSGLPPEKLAGILAPLPRFRAVQIVKWIAGGIGTFDEMDNLPLSLRKELGEKFFLRPPGVIETIHRSDDGTAKLVMEFSDQVQTEAVLLADSSQKKVPRLTACLSTQAGCPAGCVFCKTGSLGFRRNLSSDEIVEQLLVLKKIANGSPIANIVIMGMGEPLLNLAALRNAIEVFTCKEGLHFSRRRITVSTCGIVDGIIDFANGNANGNADGRPVRLALSLVTADEQLRQRLMPITVNHPLKQVKEALKIFQAKGGGRITLEIVLLGGINTQTSHARGIAQFAEGLDAIINLIPWNPVKGLNFEGSPLREPSPAEIASFTGSLESFGLNVTRRYRRGRGVMGACGQLGDKLQFAGEFGSKAHQS